MKNLPEFQSGQSAYDVNTALKSALERLDKAQHCSVFWFGEVLDRELFKELGFSSINQYAEVELGFAPSRTGYFKKLCKDLKGLPKISEKIASGELGWTKAREITKITDESNQDEMLDFALNNSRRDVEEMVRKKKQEAKTRAQEKITGQQSLLPEPKVQKKRPRAVVPVRVSMEMSPIQYAKYEALWEQLRKKKNLSAGKVDALLEIMAACLENESLEKTTRVEVPETSNTQGVRNNKPPVQLHIHHCPECNSARVQTNKGELEIGEAELERIQCDCTISIPGERNTSAIAPSIRNLVLTRARHQCQMPGCHNTCFIEVHHIIPRAMGGSNDPSNLQVLCGCCHALVHNNKGGFMVKSPSAIYSWNYS